MLLSDVSDRVSMETALLGLMLLGLGYLAYEWWDARYPYCQWCERRHRKVQ